MLKVRLEMEIGEDVDFFIKKFFFSGDDFILDKEYEGIDSVS